MDILVQYFKKKGVRPRAWCIQNGLQPDPLLNRLKGRMIARTQKALELQLVLKKEGLDLSIEEISIPNYQSLTGDK